MLISPSSLKAHLLSLLALLLVLAASGLAKPAAAASAPQAETAGPALDQLSRALRWRNVGPKRGGRSIAIGASTERPFEYYFGATGGGLWKTTDGGMTWGPVTDGKINTSSVGAIAVAPSNPDIVYIGMGEGQLRANVLQGDGVYKTTDGGKTWSHMGLAATKTITTIRVHPENPDLVYAAALGDPFAPNKERGVYRSRDGGATWTKVLFRSAEAGAIDLAMDPSDPDRLFATTWQVYRRPWKLWSGGPGSGMFTSTDGGDTWTEMTGNKGLPSGPLGKMTVAVSGADPDRLYANIEAKEGGLYRSDDGGQSWIHINGAKKLWQRSFYFMQVRPDPVDRDRVYVLSFQLERSTDGGKTFRPIRTRHVDIHDLWIDPANPERMVVADDGGGSVTVNGGKSWTEQDYSTAQIYRVETTNHEPYHICGAQQDNTTICVQSSVDSLEGPAESDGIDQFYTVGYSEMGHIAIHPKNTDIFFVGGTNSLSRYNRATQQMTDVQPSPYMVMGQAAETMEQRWNWTYPIAFSPREDNVLYVGSQHLWRSADEGQTWARISPDLTRAEPETLGPSGGLIQLDQDGPEIYGTLFALAPSPLRKKLIWTGSDDGLVHVTKDEGKNWKDVTPPSLPPHTRIASIAASAHQPGTAYIATKRYEMADRRPLIFKTTDYGENWQAINGHLKAPEFAHAIAEDPQQPGVLYLGTETGVYVSIDDGDHWADLSLNMPVTPVIDLEVRGDDLVLATHGRGFFVLEGLGLVREIAKGRDWSRPQILSAGSATRKFEEAVFFAWLPQDVSGARLDIRDESGKTIRTLFGDRRLSAGLHRFRWNLRHTGAEVFPNMILESRNPVIGPIAAPGDHTIHLKAPGLSVSSAMEVDLHPRMRSALTERALKERLILALKARDATSRANSTVMEIRKLRRKLSGGEGSEAAFLSAISAVESQLYQVNNESPKDKIALPIQLNDRLAGLMQMLSDGDGPPTEAQRVVLARLEGELDALLDTYQQIKTRYADEVAISLD